MLSTQLTENELRVKAPSIFAASPWFERSDKYQFIPTIDIVRALQDAGFYPVKADQSICKRPDKKEFARHVIRFRQNLADQSGLYPEVVLMNSHDGSSAYRLMLGFFRIVCANGLIISDKTVGSIALRHIGKGDLRELAVSSALSIIKEAPKTLETINRWEKIELDKTEQAVLASSALTAYSSTMDINPVEILAGRRRDDHKNPDGTRNLWKTYNVIQENLVKGGSSVRTPNGWRTIRAMKSVDKNVKLNQALWELTTKMEELKNGNAK